MLIFVVGELIGVGFWRLLINYLEGVLELGVELVG